MGKDIWNFLSYQIDKDYRSQSNLSEWSEDQLFNPDDEHNHLFMMKPKHNYQRTSQLRERPPTKAQKTVSSDPHKNL